GPRCRAAIAPGCREDYGANAAIGAIRVLESRSPARPLGVEFHKQRGGDAASAGVKVWSRERPIPLSERVPVLENMGFKVVDERTHRIEPGESGSSEVWLHDMMLERADGVPFDIEALKAPLEACLLAARRGRAEN